MNTFTHTFTVNEKPENYIRHVNNLRYLEWFIDTAIRHADDLGWGMEACRAMNLAWVALSHEIHYKAPAYQNDELTIITWIDKVTPTRITRCYECKRGQTTIAHAKTVWAMVDYEGEKARIIPEAVRTEFLSQL